MSFARINRVRGRSRPHTFGRLARVISPFNSVKLRVVSGQLHVHLIAYGRRKRGSETRKLFVSAMTRSQPLYSMIYSPAEKSVQ